MSWHEVNFNGSYELKIYEINTRDNIDVFFNKGMDDKGKFLIYIDPSLFRISVKVPVEETLKGRANEIVQMGFKDEEEQVRNRLIEKANKTFKSAQDVFEFIGANKNEVLDLIINIPEFKEKFNEKLKDLFLKLFREIKSKSGIQRLAFQASHLGLSEVEWANKLTHELFYKYATGVSTYKKLTEMFSPQKIMKLQQIFQNPFTTNRTDGFTKSEFLKVEHTFRKAIDEIDRLQSSDENVKFEHSNLEKCLLAAWKGILTSSHSFVPYQTLKRFNFFVSIIFTNPFRDSCLKTIFNHSSKEDINTFFAFLEKSYLVNDYLNVMLIILKSLPTRFLQQESVMKFTRENILCSVKLYLQAIKNDDHEEVLKAHFWIHSAMPVIFMDEMDESERRERVNTFIKTLKEGLTPEEFQLFTENYNLDNFSISEPTTPESSSINVSKGTDHVVGDSVEILSDYPVLPDNDLDALMEELNREAWLSEELETKEFVESHYESSMDSVDELETRLLRLPFTTQPTAASSGPSKKVGTLIPEKT